MFGERERAEFLCDDLSVEGPTVTSFNFGG